MHVCMSITCKCNVEANGTVCVSHCSPPTTTSTSSRKVMIVTKEYSDDEEVSSETQK